VYLNYAMGLFTFGLYCIPVACVSWLHDRGLIGLIILSAYMNYEAVSGHNFRFKLFLDELTFGSWRLHSAYELFG